MISPIEFYHQLIDKYFRATNNGSESIDYTLRIHDFTIRLCFAGESLVSSIIPSLEHLLTTGTQTSADFTIYLWDSFSTGMKIGRLPWSSDYYKSRGEIKDFVDENCRISYLQENGLLSIYNQLAQSAIQWIPNPSRYPSYEKAAPFRPIFQWWLHPRGYQMVHAAAVGVEGKAVLLVGKGGSGKSSAAMSCVMENMSYLGDDYCLLRTDHPPRVFSVYNSIKLKRNLSYPLLDNFPELNPDPVSDQDKIILSIQKLYPSRLVKELPVKAILLPRITHSDVTTFSRAGTSETLQALAVTTIFQLPFAGQSELVIMADFVKKVKSYWVNLSNSPREIGASIRNFIIGL